MPNVFGIADDILIADFEEWGKHHDEMLEMCSCRCMSTPFFDDIISQQGVSPDTNKIHVLTDMPQLKIKKELQSFLGILNYLSTFSPATA